MDMKYQTHLAHGVCGSLMKDSHAYWHGYNSDSRITDNGLMQKQLTLTAKRDFDRMVEEWKEQYRKEHGKDPNDDECPYKWVQITKGKDIGGGYEKEEDGLFPDDA